MSADDRAYEPPEIEELPADDGPAVTAAIQSVPPLAAEWRRDAAPEDD
ncbi:MAG: hypothetical protein QOE06_287 [Thermoleophilaceae bacterium]|jgi:hypothetical protein|nr:hypothetical protein [Thermoleophilaceae bacterium]